MRPQQYRNLDGASTRRDTAPWYWRALAGVATVMILGGFLMLPATFDSDSQLRAPRAVIGILGAAIVAVGLSLTALVSIGVRDPRFQAESVYLPAMTACAVGLLTVFYDFLISNRYAWNTPALLTTIAAAAGTVVHGALLLHTSRRISRARPGNLPYNPPSMLAQPLEPAVQNPRPAATTAYQAPAYYENYLANMYPSAAHPTSPPPGSYDPTAISSDEMLRQQMLMLLLQRGEQPPTPDPAQKTFHIDWQGEDGAGLLTPLSAPRRHGSGLEAGREMRPWDGVWRGVATAGGETRREGRGSRGSLGSREERRREIERGGMGL